MSVTKQANSERRCTRTPMRVLVAVAMAGGVLFSTGSPAQAAEAPATTAASKCVETDNDGGNNGGRACWHRGDQRYTVEDIDADGKSAWARLKYKSNGKWKKTRVIVASGEGSRANNYVDIPKGKRGRLIVCLQDNGRVLRNTCDGTRVRT